MTDRKALTNRYFRDKALKEVASPDELDHLTTLTRPASWYVLGGALCILLAGLAMAIWGTISTTVHAQGAFVHVGGYAEILAPAAGQVTDLSLEIGQEIRAGEVLGYLALSSSEPKIPITNRWDGTITEIRSWLGQKVSPGTPLLTLKRADHLGTPFQAVCFVDPITAGKIDAHLEARIVPVNLQQERDGFIRAKVKAVAELPATLEGLTRILGSVEWARAYLSHGPVIPIFLELGIDPQTKSGLSWSTPQCAGQGVAINTPFRVEIILSSQPPIQLLLPSKRDAPAESQP